MLLKIHARDKLPPGSKERKIRIWYSLNKVCIGFRHCVSGLGNLTFENEMTYLE